jgi:uncharacterized protein YbcV (DUF1398 family)
VKHYRLKTKTFDNSAHLNHILVGKNGISYYLVYIQDRKCRIVDSWENCLMIKGVLMSYYCKFIPYGDLDDYCSNVNVRNYKRLNRAMC